MSQCPISFGVQVSPLLGLPKLRPDGHCGLVPPESAHDVAGAAVVPAPAGSEQVFRDVLPIPTFGDVAIASEGDRRWAPAEVQLDGLERTPNAVAVYVGMRLRKVGGDDLVVQIADR